MRGRGVVYLREILRKILVQRIQRVVVRRRIVRDSDRQPSAG